MRLRKLLAATLASSLLIITIAAVPAEAQGLDDVVDGVRCLLRPALCIIEEGGEVVGDAVGGLIGEVAERVISAFDALVATFIEGAVQVLQASVAWWIGVDSLVTSETELITRLQQQVTWISYAMAMIGFIWAGMRIIWMRRSQPLAEVIVATLKFTFVGGAGITMIQLAARASDVWAASIVDGALNNESVNEALVGLAEQNLALLFILSLVMFLSGFLQVILMSLREVSLIFLTGLMIMAAAGQYFEFSRSWLGNFITRAIAVLAWKPAAALLLAFSFDALTAGDSLRTVLVGMGMLLASAFVYRPLMNLFSVFTPQGAGSFGGGGGGAGMAALGMGAMMMGRRSGGGEADTPSVSQPPPPQIPPPPRIPPPPVASGGGTAAGSSGAAAASGGGGAAAAGGPAGVATIAVVETGGRAAQAARGAIDDVNGSA